MIKKKGGVSKKGVKSLLGEERRRERWTPDAYESISPSYRLFTGQNKYMSGQQLLSINELLWTAVKISAIASAFTGLP